MTRAAACHGLERLVCGQQTRWVLLVDADVVFGPAGVADLLTEFVEGGYDALQAGLESVAGPGYWGRLWHITIAPAAAELVRARGHLVDRELMLGVGFDDSFNRGRTSSCVGGCGTQGCERRFPAGSSSNIVSPQTTSSSRLTSS